MPEQESVEENTTVEQQVRKAIKDAVERSDYVKNYQESLQKNPVGFLQTHLPVLGPYLISCSIEREEKVLAEMGEHSASMKRQTCAMLGFTVALTILVIVQVIIALVK